MLGTEGCSLLVELLGVLFEVVDNHFKLLLSHSDGAGVVVALSAIDDLVDNLFEGIHILELVVLHAALDERVFDLMRPVPDFLIQLVLGVELHFLAVQLYLIDLEQISVEGLFDLSRIVVGIQVNLSLLFNHLLDCDSESVNLRFNLLIDGVPALLLSVPRRLRIEGCFEYVVINFCESVNLLLSKLVRRGKQDFEVIY